MTSLSNAESLRFGEAIKSASSGLRFAVPKTSERTKNTFEDSENCIAPPASNSAKASEKLAECLAVLPREQRSSFMQTAVGFFGNAELETCFQLGTLRALFADLWEADTGTAVPILALRRLMQPPVPIRIVLSFTLLGHIGEEELPAEALRLCRFLKNQLDSSKAAPVQRTLFEFESSQDTDPAKKIRSPFAGGTVAGLNELIEAGCSYPTIYADPPWAYTNTASRAAAENHYATMALHEIASLPIRQLAAENAHLHIWTTNGFLREAFEVIEAWGFEYKSCMVWVKDEIGMGNYWRVSHEYLLLGVRGSLTFADRSLRSWVQAKRTIHSRKPATVRSLIERASPGPYLELFGREHFPNSDWTVFGNQIRRENLLF